MDITAKGVIVSGSLGIVAAVGLLLLTDRIGSDGSRRSPMAVDPGPSHQPSGAGNPTGPSPNSQSVAGAHQPAAPRVGSPKIDSVKLDRLLKLGAHPKDRQNPPEVDGVTDEEILDMGPEEVRSLFDDVLDAVNQSGTPVHYFDLGRIGLLAGGEGLAEQSVDLLLAAYEGGSEAAAYYLAQVVEDDELMLALLAESADGGFAPAVELLSMHDEDDAAGETNDAQQLFSTFNWPEFLAAAYRHQTSEHARTPLWTIAYITKLNESIGQMAWRTRDPQSLLALYDPGLENLMARKSFSEASAEEMMAMTSQAGARLFSLFNTLKKETANAESFEELLAASMGSMEKAMPGTNVTTYAQIAEYGAKDGLQLIFLYDKDPEAFEQVYRGILDFVYNEL